MGAPKKLFISRNLEADSPIWELENEGFEIFHQSLIHIEPVTVSEIPATDWVFFYSKNAFDYFLRQARELEYRLEEKKVAAIGRSTADYIEHAGFVVSFCGTGHGDTTVQEYIEVVKSDSTLFPRAKHSLNSVAMNLPQRLEVKEIVVYDNLEKDHVEIPMVDIALLTSPMNARVFFRKYAYEHHPTVITIGRSTASEAEIYSIGPVIIADQPTEESMMEAIPKILR